MSAPSSVIFRERPAHERRVLERNPDGGSVRAHLHTGRPLGTGQAEIALGRNLDVPAEGGTMKRDVDDVAPRAALAAVVAADAGVLVDRDLERAERTRDRSGRASDHAHRIRAVV